MPKSSVVRLTAVILAGSLFAPGLAFAGKVPKPMTTVTSICENATAAECRLFDDATKELVATDDGSLSGAPMELKLNVLRRAEDFVVVRLEWRETGAEAWQTGANFELSVQDSATIPSSAFQRLLADIFRLEGPEIGYRLP